MEMVWKASVIVRGIILVFAKRGWTNPWNICQISHCSDIQNGYVVNKSGMSPPCQPIQFEGGMQEGHFLLYLSFWPPKLNIVNCPRV